MSSNIVRAEILSTGFVQGVGFRYFVYKNAQLLNLKGFTENLFTGEVLTVAEGEKKQIDELIKLLKVGPRNAYVKNTNVIWADAKNEFNTFEIKY